MNLIEKLKRFGSFYRFSTGGLSFRQKFALALPGPAACIGNIIVHSALMKYYADIIGMDPKYFGWVYFIFSIWNAINDPVLGVLVDRFKYRPDRGKEAPDLEAEGIAIFKLRLQAQASLTIAATY